MDLDKSLIYMYQVYTSMEREGSGGGGGNNIHYTIVYTVTIISNFILIY